MMQDAFSIEELIPMLGRSGRAIRKRLSEESCPCETKPNAKGGGTTNYYHFPSFPEDYKSKLIDYLARKATANSENPPSIDNEGARAWAKLSERERRLALARNDILLAANSYKKQTSKKRVQRLTEFYALLGPAISGRSMDGLAKLGLTFDRALSVITNIRKASLKSHYRWEADYAEAEKSLGLGLVGLVRIKREAHGYGAKTMSAEMIAWAKSLILTGKVKLSGISREDDGRVISLNRKLLYRRLANKFAKENLPSYAHFTRWVNGWLLKEQYDLTAIALPSFHRAAFGIDGGCVSTDCFSAGQRWEVDGTKADVMLKDGRHEILAAIDVYSRDVVVEIAKTASSITVARLYYKGMLRWGVPDEIVMDNGSIFVSGHIMGAFELLNITPVLCKKYSPDDKPIIERFNGTLTKALFEGMTWYIGHDPKERKRIDEYGKFNQVFYHRKGERISCDATAEELRETIETWLEKVYRQEEHRFADVRLGRSRFILDRLANSPERAASIKNSRALEDILSPPFDRVYQNSCVTWDDIPYRPAAREDFERSLKYQKQKVLFRPNISDISSGTIWQAVPDENGKYRTGDFICRVTSKVDEQTIEAFRAARKSESRRHKERKKAVKTLFAPSYERELAEMPMPKVACANFGAVEYDGEAYRDLSGYKSEPMPDAPTSRNGRLSEDARSRIALELEEKRRVLESQNPPSPPFSKGGDGALPPFGKGGNGNGNGASGNGKSLFVNGNGAPVNWSELERLAGAEQYERLMELEVMGVEIPRQFLSSMRYFEASSDYARLEEYFERRKAALAASGRKGF